MANAYTIIEHADEALDKGKITLGEYDKIIKPWYDAEPIKHGRWEKDGEVMMFGDIPVKCSQCGFKTLQDALHRMDYHYCPNCGARMDGGESE